MIMQRLYKGITLLIMQAFTQLHEQALVMGVCENKTSEVPLLAWLELHQAQCFRCRHVFIHQCVYRHDCKSKLLWEVQGMSI